MAETVFYNSRNLVGIGNVGIGTTNPTTTLHVKGNAIVDGTSSGYYTSIIPKSSGRINNVNITALNARTRTSNASATAAVRNWTTRTSAADSGWNSVCWSPELSLFVAVAAFAFGANDRVMTSPNGINWTLRTSPSGYTWNSVCWAPELSLFVAVTSSGSGTQVMTSPTGIDNWALRTSAGDAQWNSVCWAPELSLFVAVGSSSNQVMTSPTGIDNWVLRTPAALSGWSSVCWSPELSLFVAVASGGSAQVMKSPDGINWTLSTSAPSNPWRSVCWSPEMSLFVAVATPFDAQVMTSPDGIVWTSRVAAASKDWYSVCWAPELSIFVAAASNGDGNDIMTSPNGINWTLRASPAVYAGWRSVCWAPELSIFAAVANSGFENRVMTSAIGMPNSNNVVKALTSQMVVLPSGYVGIGTANPGQLLTVWGSGTTPPFHVQSATSPGGGFYGYARFTNPSGGYGGFLINHDNTYGSPAIGNASDPPFQVKVAGYDALTVMAYNNGVNSGGVGIGTANPSSLLHLGATINNKIIALYDPTGTAAASATDFYGFGINAGVLRYQTDGGTHVFYTASSERMRIVGSNGRVGIGIAAPATSLDVSGDIACTGTLKAGNPLMFRNAIINGDFDVWQRGTSFSISAVPTYTSDRWRVNYDGTGATRTISRQTFTLGQTDVPGNPTYYLRWAQTVAGTGGTFNQVEQLIESVLTFAGQTVTVSFWAQAVSGTPTITSYVGQNFGTGGSPSAAVFPANSPTFTLSATWQKFTWTPSIPSITGKTLGTDGNDNVSFAFRAPSNAVGTWNIASIQVEAGSVATPFEARPYATELALCQRYYFRLSSSTTAQTDATFAVGVAVSGTNQTLVVQFPVTMRGFPTFASSAVNTFQAVSGTNNNITGLTLNSVGSTLNCARLTSVCTMTAGNGCVLRANSTTSAFVEFSAEL